MKIIAKIVVTLLWILIATHPIILSVYRDNYNWLLLYMMLPASILLGEVISGKIYENVGLPYKYFV